MEPTEQAAHEILAMLEATYQPTHRYVQVQAKDFAHLDLRFYDRTAKQLIGRGYRVLGDFEDKTITETPSGVLMPIMIRALVSRDGTVMGSMYDPRIKGFGLRLLLWLFRKLPAPAIDLETECTDGTFVVTTNAEAASAFATPALINAEYMAKKTPLDAVEKSHMARVAAHLAQRPGVSAKVVTSHGELLASQNRMNAIKAAHRGELGGVTREELESLAMFGRKTARDVHDAVREEQMRRAS
ncbi:MAG: hypothetical protein IT353_14645 [Gemmatimonadaceae bacterium]|nr:hypothetical protein [Gemmatimonadaceae bacterium]